MRPPTPTNELDRLAALRRYDVLDSPPERAFEDIARIAARGCGVPMALVSLVDDCRQWFKAEVGLGVRETHRDVSFCAHAILRPDLLVVPDTLEDERFATNPLVTGPPHIRFYAGAPLVTPDGFALGTLCVLDRAPRQLSLEETDLLNVLASRVVAELELHRSLAAHARVLAERDRVQIVLEQERTFLRRIIDTQPSMVFVKDWDGRFVLVNEALARCYGSTVDGVVGKTDADLNPDAGEVDHFVHDDREVMATRRLKLIAEEPVTNAEGQVNWFTTVKVPLVNEDGTCDTLLGVATDITAQKRALAALRESEQLHRTLGDVAPGFIWTVDATGRYEWVNRTWEEFTGSTCEDLNAHGWERFNHPDELPEIAQRWEAATAGGTPFEMELRYRRRDGVFRWMLCRVVPVTDEAGRVSRWVGSSVDIDDLKQMEAVRRANDERLRQAQRMEAVGRLAGGVAHDLNNMLVAILGYSNFVAKSLAADDPRRQDVEAITDAAGRSASLTRQLLAFARRDLIEPRRFDLNAAVRAAERMLRVAVAEGIEFELRLAPGELLAYADASRIEQVLLNLVLNARDAMPGGGRLLIETGRALLDGAYAAQHPGTYIRPDNYLLLSVSDTGHGMDPNTLAQVFEPFFTTKPFGEGTGLGLSTAYGSIKQAGGLIWAYSEPGQGTVFKVYLPEVGGTADPLPRGLPAVAGEGKLILVVDDAEAVRRTTRRSLELQGYRCIEAASAAEALELVRTGREPVDLVLTDVVMPGMGGRELGSRLEVLRPGLPVLFVSGYTEEDILQRGLLEKGRPFLAKPFTPDAIAAKVGTVLAV
ncbi:MAG: PAS domain S-box protein [Gemmatimonadales bacterium]